MRRRLTWVTALALVPLLFLHARRIGGTLWVDEASSIWFARLPWLTILTRLCDPHPPGYYLFLKLWLSVAESEWWLRLPSLLFAAGAVYFTIRLSRALGWHRTAWVAGLLLLFHPLQWWYAGEIRMYAVVQMCGVAAVWLAVRYFRADRGWGVAVGYIVAITATLWSDTTGVLAWGVAQLLWLATGRPRPRRWIGLQIVALVPTLAAGFLTGWLPLQGGSYQPVFIAVQAARLGLDISPADAGRVLLVILIAAAAAIVALAAAWPTLCDRLRWGRWLPQSVAWSLLLLWLLVLALSFAPRLYTVKRLVMVLLPFVALGAARARLPRLSGAQVRWALLGFGYLLCVWVLVRHPHPPWRETIMELVYQEPDSVWVDEQIAPLFDYYAGEQGALWQALRLREMVNLPVEGVAAPLSVVLVEVDSPYSALEAALPDRFYAWYEAETSEREAGIARHRYVRRAEPLAEPLRPNLGPLAEWQRLLPSPLALCGE